MSARTFRIARWPASASRSRAPPARVARWLSASTRCRRPVYLRDVVRPAVTEETRASGRDPEQQINLITSVFIVTSQTESERTTAAELRAPADRLLCLDTDLQARFSRITGFEAPGKELRAAPPAPAASPFSDTGPRRAAQSASPSTPSPPAWATPSARATQTTSSSTSTRTQRSRPTTQAERPRGARRPDQIRLTDRTWRRGFIEKVFKLKLPVPGPRRTGCLTRRLLIASHSSPRRSALTGTAAGPMGKGRISTTPTVRASRWRPMSST